MLRLFAGSTAPKQQESSDSRGFKRKRSESVDDTLPSLEDMPNVAETPSEEDPEPHDYLLTVPAVSPSRLFNSSNQLPSRSAGHNRDMMTASRVPHLLQLPAAVMNRILSEVLITEDPYEVQHDGRINPKRTQRYYETDNNKRSPGAEVIRKPGILEVCKSIRDQALPIFYVGNSFVLHVQAFNAGAFEPWWQRRKLRTDEAQRSPILIADVDGTADISRRELRYIDRDILHHAYATYDVLMIRKRSFATSELREGLVEMQVQYDPHWANLSKWLFLYHQGTLPPLHVADASTRLSRVTAMFASVGAYKGSFEWEVAAKGLKGHRQVLIADSEQWSVEDGKVQDDGQDKSLGENSSQTMRSDSQTIRDEPTDFYTPTPIIEDHVYSRPREQSPVCEKQKVISISDDDDEDKITDDDDANDSKPIFGTSLRKNLAQASVRRNPPSQQARFSRTSDDEDLDALTGLSRISREILDEEHKMLLSTLDTETVEEDMSKSKKKKKTSRGRGRQPSLEL